MAFVGCRSNRSTLPIRIDNKPEPRVFTLPDQETHTQVVLAMTEGCYQFSFPPFASASGMGRSRICLPRQRLGNAPVRDSSQPGPEWLHGEADFDERNAKFHAVVTLYRQTLRFQARTRSAQTRLKPVPLRTAREN